MKPLLIVSGLARCGTSLTMQMFFAAGIRCDGGYPDFEGPLAERAVRGDFSGSWMEEARGSAVKLLDPWRAWPQRAKLPHGTLVFWLNRDPEQQVLSQLKLMSETGHIVSTNRDARRKALTRIGPETRQSLRLIKNAGARVHEIRFETLISNPAPIVGGICHLLRDGFGDLNPYRMLNCIVARDPACMPDRAIELGLAVRGPKPFVDPRTAANG